ncbi:hypothetical protein E5288_WYG009032 [Bos mutus]|uniref:Uncharacterized protein n=1 Tax=Bos mutus TaxID=72004 RepID=A0A6B0QVC2_9CETA|nr:hypothetical protein [Bos mutus]
MRERPSHSKTQDIKSALNGKGKACIFTVIDNSLLKTLPREASTGREIDFQQLSTSKAHDDPRAAVSKASKESQMVSLPHCYECVCAHMVAFDVALQMSDNTSLDVYSNFEHDS